MNEETISEIKITINMTREEYIKRAKLLKILFLNNMGASFIFLLILLCFLLPRTNLFFLKISLQKKN